MTDDGADSAEIAYLQAWTREYSDHFVLAYHSGDLTLMHPYCHVPSFRFTADGLRAMTTYADIDAHWKAAHDALRPRGYNNSVLHTVDVELLTPRSALITADCSRYDVGDKEIMRFWTSYAATKTEDGWRIAAWFTRGERRL